MTRNADPISRNGPPPAAAVGSLPDTGNHPSKVIPLRELLPQWEAIDERPPEMHDLPADPVDL